MRPEVLFSLFAPVQSLPGVGEKVASHLQRMGCSNLVDLLWHLPTGVVDRRAMPPLNQSEAGSVITSVVTVEEHMPPERRAIGKPYRVRCYNETGFLTLVFFNAYGDTIKKQLPVGHKRVVSGKIEDYHGEKQMPHPDYVVPEAELEKVKRVEPVYPLTYGLTNRMLLKYIAACMPRIPELPEWIQEEHLKRFGWSTWKSSLMDCHQPDAAASLDPKDPARSRLAYDELLANQLALLLMRNKMRKHNGQKIEGDGRLRNALLEALPFTLTEGQNEMLTEIVADQASDGRMHRMLQGDVGSGKTVVALMAMLNVVETGKQAAMLAPTEILARQHMAWISKMVAQCGVRVALLTSRQKGKERKAVLDALASGEIDLLIGTHAIFQEAVNYNNLALAVIDEQHRFGVEQRLLLAKKGKNVDMLLMSATPIPRTLTLTMYGDMDCSRLMDKPKGRKPIDTRTISLSRMADVVGGVKRAMATGKKMYWICPLVEESEELDLAAAEERFRHFQKMFGDNRVGLVHGKMKGEERENVMTEFKEGNIQLLVATTVIEVGVDVPDATLMVIEHADRFGLAQLHQLRGRVGRSDAQSSCVLLYGKYLNDTTRARLNIMRETEDGFLIAEEDLRLRGGGEILGTRQSGMQDFRLANLSDHYELLQIAYKDAQMIVHQNELDKGTKRGEALRVLLHLFAYDSQVQYMKVG